MYQTLGIDIGTTGIKIVLIREDGTILKTESMSHDLSSPQNGFAEEDTEIWKVHLFTLLQELSKGGYRVDAISVTGMVPTLIALDERCQVLYPSIQQNDNRATLEMEALRNQFNDYFMLSHTGTRINQQHIAPKLLWLRKHMPDLTKKIRYIIGSYSYIGYLLTGNLRTERNWALESGMYDIHTKQWMEEILDVCGINEDMLPPLVNPTDIIGTTTKESALQTGLREGIPVVSGTADHVASAFCIGARKEGDLVFKLGGAGDILLAISRLTTDPRLFIDYGCTPEVPFYINGCTATCGSLLKWFEREMQLPDFTIMDQEATLIPPTAEGITILPYFLGEKTPIFDPHAKGIIFGLTLNHTKNHIYRALLEAVAYSINHHVKVMKELHLPINRVFITNGGSRSKLWRQILADVTGYDVRYVKNNLGSCLGAALLAGIGTGAFDDKIADKFLREGDINIHNPQLREIYQKGYYRYRKLYESLKPFMTETDKELLGDNPTSNERVTQSS